MRLEILQAFHGYLLKYLDMIKRGHLPFHHNRVNEDARVFLQRLLPRGTAADRFTLAATCRTLYLAFKQMDAGEVYDVLAVCLIPGGQPDGFSVSVR